MHVMIGKGVLKEEDDKAIAEFKLNLEIEAARDWHSALKFDLDHPPAMQEWSYGFDILESGEKEIDGQKVRVLKKLKVHEISPVLLGAGIGTQTIAIKGEKQFEIQTLIFPKMHWTEEEAVSWAKEHDFRADKVDETEDSWRIRQFDPDEFERLRTICINPGRHIEPSSEDCRVKAVGGPRKGLRFADQLVQTIESVESMLTRAQAIAQKRAESGQTYFSEERLQQIGELKSVLIELEKVTGEVESFMAGGELDESERAALALRYELAMRRADSVLGAS
jgi:hypothetical protein